MYKRNMPRAGSGVICTGLAADPRRRRASPTRRHRLATSTAAPTPAATPAATRAGALCGSLTALTPWSCRPLGPPGPPARGLVDTAVPPPPPPLEDLLPRSSFGGCVEISHAGWIAIASTPLHAIDRHNTVTVVIMLPKFYHQRGLHKAARSRGQQGRALARVPCNRHPCHEQPKCWHRLHYAAHIVSAAARGGRCDACARATAPSSAPCACSSSTAPSPPSTGARRPRAAGAKTAAGKGGGRGVCVPGQRARAAD